MSDNEIETMFKKKPSRSNDASESIILSAIPNDTEVSHANGDHNDKLEETEEESSNRYLTHYGRETDTSCPR